MKKGIKYALFIGRWQGVHDGHLWLWNTAISKGIPALVAIRDVEPDEKNPFRAQEVEYMIRNKHKNLIASGMLDTLIIPDISSVNYGRNVGYEVIEHVPPAEISQISATELRKKWVEEGLLK